MATFPIRGGKFSNDFAAHRPATGRHGGIDIFAPRGTPIRAIEGGTITEIGWNKLGGWRLWVNGVWYYAHLDRYAKNLKAGDVVQEGQIIGYVGDTGNAKGTSPHLHLGYAPRGGTNWENPYKILVAARDGGPGLTSDETAPGSISNGDTSDAPTTDDVRAAAVGSSLQSIQGPQVGAAMIPAALGFPGEQVSSPPPAPPPVETWRALSLMPGASSDTLRMLSLISEAYQGE